jgi:hypothetical protein
MKWISLANAADELIRRGLSKGTADEIVTKIVLDGHIPLRGYGRSDCLTPSKINGPLDGACISIDLSTIHCIGINIWRDVELGEAEFLAQLHYFVPSKMQLRKPSGPTPGTIKRQKDSDAGLMRKVEEMVRRGMSSRQAALSLAQAGKITGAGTQESKAKRIERKFNKLRSAKSS